MELRSVLDHIFCESARGSLSPATFSCPLPQPFDRFRGAFYTANVTGQPTAEWTIQQFREVLAGSHPHRFVIHDRDSIFSSLLGGTLEGFGVRVIRTPILAPNANAYCEREIGTNRRECLTYVIPINQRHLQRTLTEFVGFYNRGQQRLPHSNPRSLFRAVPESEYPFAKRVSQIQTAELGHQNT